MSKLRPLCLVFDLDDTVYLERDYVRSGFRAVGAWASAEIRVDDFAGRAWSLFEAGQRRNVFDTALAEAGFPASPELISRMLNVYRNHRPNISLLPDAERCLHLLQGQCRLALISDGYLAAQERKVEALGVARLLDTVVLTDRWGPEYWKPHHRAFEYIESLWTDESLEFAYVADNPAKDFTAPLALGWTAIRVRRPGGLHFEAAAGPGLEAVIEIGGLADLPAALAIADGTTAELPAAACS